MILKLLKSFSILARHAVILFLAFILFLTCGSHASTAPLGADETVVSSKTTATAVENDTEARITALIAKMTLEEKLEQICGKDFMDGNVNTRLGIPALMMTDGPHGVARYDKNTGFPPLVTMGATWNPELCERFGMALGQETKARGRNLILGPCVNIHRTPLGGRNFESLGEDPWLVSRLAVAYVKGVQSQNIGTSTKHFACNNQEVDRNKVSVEIDERTLREIYLPAFRAAVMEAGTYSVMGAYNKINGDFCNENQHLLQDILKNEWGFTYFVVSDWWAIQDNVKAALSGCDMDMPGPGCGGSMFVPANFLPIVRSGRVPESVIDDKVRRVLRVKFALGFFDSKPHGEGAVNTPEHQTLARNIAEEAIVLLKNERNTLPLDCTALRSVAIIGPNARKAPGGGGSSVVMPLYTITPFDGISRLCGRQVEIVFSQGCTIGGDFDAVPESVLRTPGDHPGLNAEYFTNTNLSGEPVITRTDRNIDFDWGFEEPAPGIGSENFSVRWIGKVTATTTGDHAFSLYSDDGSRLFIDENLLIDNWGDHGPQVKMAHMTMTKGQVSNVRIEFYERSGGACIRFGWQPPGDSQIAKAVAAAKRCDVAIVVAGLNDSLEGEGVDRHDMMLPDGQDQLIAAVAAANPKTVVVLMNGTPVDMRAWVDSVPAIVEAWYPGMEGGNAIANILFGTVNPSGKLPVTFPRQLSDNPSWGNYPGDGSRVFYKEGIFVGYRHYDAHDVVPLFPFGHGLSYTTFAYSDLVVTPLESGSCEVSFDLANSGQRVGSEVAQVYVADPVSSLPRPPKELKGFRKITLAPGEKQRISLRLDCDAFSFYDPAKHDWVMEPGLFRILIGSSSRDIRLEKEITLPSTSPD
jgi:beta-glucosidase